MTGIVQDRQSVLDLALQYFGTPEAAFTVADRLGIAVTDTPTPGAAFDYLSGEVIDQHVVDYYLRKGIVPTTEIEKQPK